MITFCLIYSIIQFKCFNIIMSETYSLFLNDEEFFIPRDFELLNKMQKKS